MNSVIFLDIDGVCNNKADYSKPRQSDAELLPDRTLQILKRIVDSTGAKIVLSSSWRFRLADVVNNRLGDFGLFLLDKTTTVSLDDPRRAAEIDLWLSNNPDFNAMAILDDDDRGHPSRVLFSNIIQHWLDRRDSRPSNSTFKSKMNQWRFTKSCCEAIRLYFEPLFWFGRLIRSLFIRHH
jgi:hypothetical protein